MRATPQAFTEPFKVGLATMTGPGDEEWRYGLPVFQLLLDYLQTSLGISILPYAVFAVTAADLGSGGADSKPAARAAMAK
eukprot:1137234-Rhodomonas_salina.1